MDQDHFRQLLGASTSTPSSSGTSKFGKAPPKPTVSSTGKTTDFKPRPPKKPKKDARDKQPGGTAADGYRDRAAERRAGKEGDFAGAEKLLQEFEARTKTEQAQADSLFDAAEGQSNLDEQRKYLGGDAEHSILVKGLDMALLERNKAELAKRQEEELEDVEALLDEQLENPSEVKGKGKEKEREGKKGKGKSRDELLIELKASREGNGQAGFKPIGGAEETGLGKGWKKLGATTSAPIPAAGEKKLRKKKKKVPVTETAAPMAPPALLDAATPTTTAKVTPSVLAPAPAPTAEPPIESGGGGVNSDDDIFGDAGSYKGLSDSDSDAEDDSKPKSAQVSDPTTTKIKEESPSAGGAGSKRKYFDDDDDEQGEITTAPSAVADLASRQASHAAASASTTRNRGEGLEDDSDEEGEGGTTMKLQPLSGSRGPSVKELLEMDKAAEEEEKRKAKKLKRQQKAEGGGAEKELSHADKSNRDYLQMEAYLAKKKGGGVEKGGEEE